MGTKRYKLVGSEPKDLSNTQEWGTLQGIKAELVVAAKEVDRAVQRGQEGLNQKLAESGSKARITLDDTLIQPEAPTSDPDRKKKSKKKRRGKKADSRKKPDPKPEIAPDPEPEVQPDPEPKFEAPASDPEPEVGADPELEVETEPPPKPRFSPPPHKDVPGPLACFFDPAVQDPPEKPAPKVSAPPPLENSPLSGLEALAKSVDLGTLAPEEGVEGVPPEEPPEHEPEEPPEHEPEEMAGVSSVQEGVTEVSIMDLMAPIDPDDLFGQ